MLSNKRNQSGQSLLEGLTSFIIMIPIALFAIDVICMIVASQTNEHAAQQASRAAANQRDDGGARQAADFTINNDFHSSPIVSKIAIEDINYDPDATGNVSVTTRVDMNLPVPFPGMKSMTFTATSSSPIVAIPNPK